ncbi:hypothetical protein BC828DRAFT_391074 [Blastocladiella britannica]|nr:hypothetical protein BC828DRAFT_391074 [Blastocladiella britannica]
MGKTTFRPRVDKYFELYNPQSIIQDGSTVHVGFTQPVVFSLALFHGTLSRWILDPASIKHLVPAYATFVVLSDTGVVQHSPTAQEPGTGRETRTVVRELHAKGAHHPHVVETVHMDVDWDRGTARYAFEPTMPTVEAVVASGNATNDQRVCWLEPDMDYFHAAEYAFQYAPLAAATTTATTAVEEATLDNPAPALTADAVLRPTATMTLEWTPLSPELAAAATTAGIPPQRPDLWTNLMARAFKWSTHDMLGGYTPVEKDVFVDRATYTATYKRLKRRYADLLTTWTEKTDPQKFVHEDMALASYLICVWSHPRFQLPSQGPNQRQRVVFADLGCGNGLLTYLLGMEGYQGYGIDLRSRKIWPRWTDGCGTIKLIEQTVDFASYQLPADVTWVLGNHADELCPWIAEIGRRDRAPPMFPTSCTTVSSATQQQPPAPYLFILPCCFFNRDGVKFSAPASDFPVPPHLASAGSRYKRYLQYVGEQCAAQQYNVMYDALRIPSTKNLALICTPRELEAAVSSSSD